MPILAATEIWLVVFPAENADILGLAGSLQPLGEGQRDILCALVSLAPEDRYNPDTKMPHLLRPREYENQLPGAQLSLDLCWCGKGALNFPYLYPFFHFFATCDCSSRSSPVLTTAQSSQCGTAGTSDPRILRSSQASSGHKQQGNRWVAPPAPSPPCFYVFCSPLMGSDYNDNKGSLRRSPSPESGDYIQLVPLLDHLGPPTPEGLALPTHLP